MSEQTKFEVIKAIAYGGEPQEIADAEGISLGAVQVIQQSCSAEIAEERNTLKGAGYID